MYSINMYRLYALSTDVCLIQKFINVQWHIMLGWVGIPKWHGMLWYTYIHICGMVWHCMERKQITTCNKLRFMFSGLIIIYKIYSFIMYDDINPSTEMLFGFRMHHTRNHLVSA